MSKRSEEKKYYVYEWFNVESGEIFYIGKGCNNRYCQLSGRNKFFMDYYKTHKCESRKVYTNLSEEDAFAKEIELIAFYKEKYNFRLTNMTEGGDGHPFKFGNENPKYGKGFLIKGKNNPFYGKKHSQRTRRILSKLATKRTGELNPFYGKKHSEETRRILSIKAKERFLNGKNPMEGRNHSEETRRKISEMKKGKVLSEQTKLKISKTLKGKYVGEKSWNYGRKHSEEYRRKCRERSLGENNPNWGNGDKIRGEKNPMYGKKHSEETRRKISEKMKNRKFNCLCKICGKSFEGRSWNSAKCDECKDINKK